MPVSELKLIKRCAEFIHRDKLEEVPPRRRGIYVLFRYRPRLHSYDVVYVGMAARGDKASMKRRLRSHSRKKAGWTHFSIFEVWDNIQKGEIEELEGLFRHIYRSDTRANRLNVQRGYKKLKKVRDDNLKSWRK